MNLRPLYSAAEDYDLDRVIKAIEKLREDLEADLDWLDDVEGQLLFLTDMPHYHEELIEILDELIDQINVTENELHGA